MRTGSNLLESNLSQAVGVAGYGEVFNPAFIGREKQETCLGFDLQARNAAPLALVNALKSQAGLNGFRLFSNHDQRVLDHVLADHRCAKIILKRDPIDSFLSREAARKTGQWRVGQDRARQVVGVDFDSDRFDDYCAGLAAYYQEVEQTILLSGQSFFPIQYDQCKSLPMINGLLRWLGTSHDLQDLKEVTKRQNPTGLRDRISNFEDFQRYLDRSGYVVERQGVSPEFWRLNGQVSVWEGPHLVCVDLPGCPRSNPTAWIKRPFSWLARSCDKPVFIALDDPVARAERVFRTHILPAGEDGFPHIRTALNQNYGAGLPERDQPLPPPEDLQKAFAAFVEFTNENLRGLTGQRTDATWLPQTRLVEVIAEMAPVFSVVPWWLRDAGLTYLSALTQEDLSGQFLPQTGDTEGSIATKEVREKLKSIYSADYRFAGKGLSD